MTITSDNVEPTPNNKSFQRQLYLVLIIGILCISLLLSFFAAWTNSEQTGEMMVRSGLLHAANAAKQSRLALLYASSDSADETARSILAFPGIVHIAIINPDLTVLYEIGTQITQHKLTRPDIQQNTAPQLINEDESEWHFLAPVFLKKQSPKSESDNQDIALTEANKIIGYVYLSSDKSSLKQTQSLSMKYNFIAGLIISLAVIIFLHFFLAYFFKPLNELTEIMHRSTQGGRLIQSNIKGPEETEKITIAYNRLVNTIIERDKKLKSHNNLLESLVSMRTRELEAARDAAIEAARHKSTFLSNTTHELRTPLQSISGYAEAAIEVALEEGHKELVADLESILQSANHLLSLINTILDMTKAEAGAMELSNEYANIDDIISQSEKTAQPLMEKNTNTLLINNSCQDKHMQIDKGKLLQIILNLLSNAAKFTRNGTIQMDIECNSGQLKIRVSDTGIGIAANKQEQIFRPFQQADGSVTRKYGGTGLGLSITDQFCRLMGGSIKLTSTEGKGSTFEVILPLTTSND